MTEIHLTVFAQQLLDSTTAANEVDEVFDRDDDMTDEERAYVHERVIASIQGRRAGAPTYDASDVMAELVART